MGGCGSLFPGDICCDLLVKYGGKMEKKVQGQRVQGKAGGL